MTSSPDSRHIAPHLREHIFRGYEQYLAIAVSSWPQATSFTIPPNIASATFIANFRNAVQSLLRYSWNTNIDVAKLRSIDNPRVFVINLDTTDNKVWFRSPPKKEPRSFTSTVGTRAERETGHTSSSPSSLVPLRDWTGEELFAICLLLANRRIAGPILLDGKVDEKVAESQMSLRDVAIVYDAERKQTVIT